MIQRLLNLSVIRTCSVCCLLLLGGCATSHTTSSEVNDPFERYNRIVFAFNDGVDRAVLKPVATGYEKVVPSPLQTAVSNVFSNIDDIWIGVNNLLQADLEAGLSDGMRVLVNTFFGFAGILDFATEMGLEKHDEDFGQTLAHWGVGEGPFLMLPFFGPRTTRDAAALPVDMLGSEFSYIEHIPTRNTVAGLRIVSERAQLLGLEKTLDEGTLDKYIYVRDFYLQQRRFRISGGELQNSYEDFDVPDDMVPADSNLAR